jgi:hypothetical protein
MSKLFFIAIAILVAAISLFMVFKRVKKAAYPQMPKELQTVATLKYNAYTSAMQGQVCTVKGVCIKKLNSMAAILLADKFRDTFGEPVECVLGKTSLPVYEMIEPGAELVVTGIITFLNGTIVLKEVKIISIQANDSHQ